MTKHYACTVPQTIIIITTNENDDIIKVWGVKTHDWSHEIILRECYILTGDWKCMGFVKKIYI